MYYVYILITNRSRYYTGFTSNLKDRIANHKSDKVKSTKQKGANLIYYEACLNKFDAIRREKYLKSGRGKIYIKSRLKFWIEGKEPGARTKYLE